MVPAYACEGPFLSDRHWNSLN